MKHTIRTNLKGLKRFAWHMNLDGFFTLGGIELTDKEVRTLVCWAISKGYTYESDIPVEEAKKVLKSLK